MLKNNWTIDEIREIYHSPILDLVFRAASIHRENNQIGEVQVCTLLSVKTGGCPEDCSYCPQAARYNTGVKVHKLLDKNRSIGQSFRSKKCRVNKILYGCSMARNKRQ
jgi:biotin synthase